MEKVAADIIRSLKHFAYSAYSGGLALRHSFFREIISGPITVAGLLSATTGIGVGARLSLTAFSSLGYRTNAIDLCARLRDHFGVPFSTTPPDADDGGTIIFHVNPPELPVCINHCAQYIRNKKLIGFWAWELSKVPFGWRMGSWYIDEIWVPSSFVREALADYSKRPIKIVPHPVIVPAINHKTRRDFGVPETSFLVLGMCDLRSSAARKNPLGSILAFRRAFSAQDDACLLLKINNPDAAPSIFFDLQSAAAGYKNILFLVDPLPTADIATLISLSDAVISLHRSEGFGLLLAEAMILGTPVIATGWSGNMDFMTPDNSLIVDYKLGPVIDPQGIYVDRRSFWAEPFVEHAAELLKQLFSDSGLRQRLAYNAASDARRSFGCLESFKQATGL